jgi:integrase
MQAHDLQFTPGPRPSRRTLRAAPQVSELVDLRWEQVDFNHAVLQVRRVKKGTPATHPIIGDEMRALTAAKGQEPKSGRKNALISVFCIYKILDERLICNYN